MDAFSGSAHAREFLPPSTAGPEISSEGMDVTARRAMQVDACDLSPPAKIARPALAGAGRAPS